MKPRDVLQAVAADMAALQVWHGSQGLHCNVVAAEAAALRWPWCQLLGLHCRVWQLRAAHDGMAAEGCAWVLPRTHKATLVILDD